MAWSEVASFHLSDSETPPRHTHEPYDSPPPPPPPPPRPLPPPHERCVAVEEDEEEEEEDAEEAIGYTIRALAAISSSLDKPRSPLGPDKAPPTPHNAAKPGSPSLGRERRRERAGQSPVCGRTCPSLLENVKVSPRKTPSKCLPFSPLRVRRFPQY